MSWQVTAVDRLFDLIGDSRGKIKPYQIHKDAAMIMHVAREIVKGPSGVDCFFLMVNHNGKKKTIPHELKYRSVAMGCCEEWLMPRFKMVDYQNIEMDNEYNDLLRKIKHDEEWHVEAEKLMDGRLKQELHHLNLKTASFYHVHETKSAKWYVMVGSAVPDEFYSTPAEQHELILAVNKVKFIVKKYQ